MATATTSALSFPCNHHTDTDAQCKGCSISDQMLDYVASCIKHLTGWSCRDAQFIYEVDEYGNATYQVKPYSCDYSFTVQLVSCDYEDDMIEVAHFQFMADDLDDCLYIDVTRTW